MITLQRLKELIHYDPLTGVFTRIAVPPKSKAKLGPIKGYAKKEGHLRTCVDGHEFYLARLAYFYMTGIWGEIIDHKDGNPQNNKFANLRNTTAIGNIHNQVKAHHHNKSGLLGAHWRADKNKYESAITVCGKKKRLGYFKTAEDAHEAYKRAKRQLHPTCTI